MALTITHPFVSAIADDPASASAGEVLPSHWNADHTLTGSVAASEITSGEELTKTDDTNVTLTLGGTPATALLKATSLTLGWTGTLAVSRGGTGAGALTEGSIVFAGPSGTYSQDNTNLFWDDSNNVLKLNDVGLARNMAGTLEVNNGTAGTFGDLKASAGYFRSVAVDPLTGTTDAILSLFPRNGGVQVITSIKADTNGNLVYSPVSGGQNIFTGSFMNAPRVLCSVNDTTNVAFFFMNDSSSSTFGSLNQISPSLWSIGHTTDLSTINTSSVVWDNLGNVAMGIPGAIATNATDGFLYIPTCAGTPTGVPTTFTGKVAMIFDTTNNKLYIYDGGWLGGTTPGAFT
jgi:hypothetical protein